MGFFDVDEHGQRILDLYATVCAASQASVHAIANQSLCYERLPLPPDGVAVGAGEGQVLQPYVHRGQEGRDRGERRVPSLQHVARYIKPYWYPRM